MPEYTRFALDEPPVWGSAEMPLLPAEWASAGKSFIVPGIYRTRGERHLPVSLDAFCCRHWSLRIGVDTSDDIASRRRRNLDPRERTGPFGDIHPPVLRCARACLLRRDDVVARPLFTKRVVGNTSVLGLPVLRSTKRTLKSASLLGRDLADFLTAGTFEELLHRLGRLRASLDLLMTARSWLTDNGDGVLRATPRLTYPHILGTFHLARMRNMRQLGVCPSNAHYTTEMADATGVRAGLWEEGDGTLEQASCILGLTRQRLQQLEKTFSGLANPRCWGLPRALRGHVLRIRRQENTQSFFRPRVEDRVDDLSRSGLLRVIRFNGVPIVSRARQARRLDTLLSEAHLTRAEIVARAYELSGDFGFIRRDDLLSGLRSTLTRAEDKDLELLATELSGGRGLPHGYVFLHASHRTWVTSRIINTLRHLRRIAVDELHAALERNRIFHKRPRMPPKEVLKAFLRQDRRFVLENEQVALRHHAPRSLTGGLSWIASQLAEGPSQSIHRTVLLARARDAGQKVTTISVYAQYSMLFKPVGRGCIALVGTYPTDEDVGAANDAARAIRIKSRVMEWEMGIDGPLIRLLVGNDCVDSGIVSLKKEIRQFLSNRDLILTSVEGTHGRARVSGAMVYGLMSVCAALTIVPGDVILLTARLSSDELYVALSEGNDSSLT
jgi:hypothetical protein